MIISNPPAKGIAFSKKANLWVAYICLNLKDKANTYTWCKSKEEALEKLQGYG